MGSNPTIINNLCYQNFIYNFISSTRHRTYPTHIHTTHHHHIKLNTYNTHATSQYNHLSYFSISHTHSGLPRLLPFDSPTHQLTEKKKKKLSLRSFSSPISRGKNGSRGVHTLDHFFLLIATAAPKACLFASYISTALN